VEAIVAGTYRGVPGHVRREQRRQVLIETGLDCLHEDGLAGISVRSVCSRAQLTPRYFYESFTDLDALLCAVVDTVAEEIVARGVAAVAAGESIEQRVRGAIAAGYGVVAEDRRKATAILICAAGHGPLRDRRHTLLVEFAQIITDTLPLPRSSQPSTHALALFLLGGAFDVIEAVLSERLVLTGEELVDELTVIWMAALRSIQPAGADESAESRS
jgi:AcrR family transcriptional regulator